MEPKNANVIFQSIIARNLFFGALLFAILVVELAVCFNSEFTFDAGDGLEHYLISRWSWQHPELFFHHWGKPMFTLLSSPFTQFGYFGMNAFQILCGIATAFFCYRIALKLQLKFAWLVAIFIFFAPIYFSVVNSGLTEILFACLLMFCIWMIFKKEYIVAALAASFLPFVRVEALVTVPLMVFILFRRKQWAALSLLPTGFIIFSFAGSFFHHDLLWVIHQNQDFFTENYPGSKGDFFHYIRFANKFLGLIPCILIIISIIWAIFYYSKKTFRKENLNYFEDELVLVFGCFFACLILNMLSYSVPGILNNLGMLRYMTTLVPCASLIALRGLNVVLAPVNRFAWIQVIIIAILVFLTVKYPFQRWPYPFKLDGEPKYIKVAADYLKENNLEWTRLSYFHPSFPLFYDVDPFDTEKIVRYIDFNSPPPSEQLPSGSIIIWDAHFGPTDFNAPLEKIENNSSIKLLKTIQTVEKYTVMNSWLFEIRIYRVM